MNTNRGIASSSTINAKSPATPVAPIVPQIEKSPQAIPTLVKVLQSVKLDSPEAKLNKTTISDGEGGRIEMNEDELNGTIFGSINNKVW